MTVTQENPAEAIHASRTRHGTSLSRFYQPRKLAFWIYVVSIVVGAVWLLDTLADPTLVYARHGIYYPLLYLVIWLPWAILGIWLITRIDVYGSLPWSIRIAAFGLPAVLISVSTAIVTPLNAALRPRIGPFAAAFGAPIPEDGVKLAAVVLIAFIAPSILRRPVGAVVCGLLAGLGFAFSENWWMSYDHVDDIIRDGDFATIWSEVTGWMIGRGFMSLPFTHPVIAAIAAIGVYYVVSRPQLPLLRRLAVAAAFFLLGAILHCLTDLMEPAFKGSTWMMIGYWSLFVYDIAILIGLIVWSIRSERRWLTEITSGPIPQQVISPEEAKTLLTRQRRRQARKTIRETEGRPAARKLKTLQRLKLAYANAFAEPAPPAETNDARNIRQMIETLRESNAAKSTSLMEAAS